MFLGSYEFAGDPAELVDRYDRMVAGFPPEVFHLHVCVTHEHGITIFDACPTRAVFEHFSRGDDFRRAYTGAGLPEPTVTLLGDVHAVRTQEATR